MHLDFSVLAFPSKVYALMSKQSSVLFQYVFLFNFFSDFLSTVLNDWFLYCGYSPNSLLNIFWKQNSLLSMSLSSSTSVWLSASAPAACRGRRRQGPAEQQQWNPPRRSRGWGHAHVLLRCQHRRGCQGRVRPWCEANDVADDRAAQEAAVHSCLTENAKETEVQLICQQWQQPTQQRQFDWFTENSFTRRWVFRENQGVHNTDLNSLTLLKSVCLHASLCASPPLRRCLLYCA